ncbi:MAG: hypothetical protein GX197_01935 [Firmicutes bacterium]|nr:hypothetical protein [Bacillota bacterium]
MIDVVIFEGSAAKSPVEKMLVKARHGALQDNLDKFISLPEIQQVILITNQPGLAALDKLPKVTVEMNNLDPTSFHFGRQLVDVIERYHIETILCLGGAAVPLLEKEELEQICRQVLAGPRRFVTNNVQSADIIAFRPAGILKQFPPVISDNALALLLRYDAKFEQVLMPVTVGTQFDIDTPTDLLVLAASPFGGPHLRAALEALALDTSIIKRAKKVLYGDYEEVALIGRVGAPAIALVNQNFKVRLRVFSEERGMKALGRLERNEVVSLLGYWLEEIGPQRFFAYLAQTVAAALIDTRVLFAHFKTDPSDADRFYSDLFQYEQIQDPFVREFTRAANECPIPVILGGHSLVSGCIHLLAAEVKSQK